MKKNNQLFESARKHVDKYAATILGRISDEKERNSRGFQVAKLYVNIKEYDVAKRYMAGFLAIKPSYAPAHKLMGQIYENLGDTKKAIAAYKLSLELDSSQKDILLIICELSCTTDIDPEQAKYWADRVEKVFPRKNIAFRLREKIYSTTSNLDINHSEMAQLLALELKKHPRDVVLHMKLLRIYIDRGRVNEAYKHALDTERLRPYPDSLEWYQCLADILQEYQQENDSEVNGVFHEHLLGVLCNLSAVSLSKANIFDCMDILHKLDQTLQKVSEMQLPQEAWRMFFEEIKAQFFYHAGILLCKKAKQLRLSWREACDMAAACFAVSATVPCLDTSATWCRQMEDPKTYQHWERLGNLRLSQVAHMLTDMQKHRDCDWQRTLQAEIFTKEGQERLFQLLFSTPHLQASRDKSYLLHSSAFKDISMEIPDTDLLQLYDDVSDQLMPQSLHHIVWKALHHYSAQDRKQPQYDFKVFADLYEGGVNIDQTTAPESLCQYDVEAFLCLTIHCAALRLAEYEGGVPDEPGRPRLLPAAICDALSLPQQEECEDLGRLRLIVSSGIGVLRMRGNHSLDPRLGIYLARTFQQRWDEAIEAGSPDVRHRQSRALYYWRSVVDTLSDLERQQHGHRIQRPQTQLFPLTDTTPLSGTVLKECADEGRFLLGRIAMTEGRLEEAVEQFKLVNTPSANLDLGKAYRELAARIVRQPQLEDADSRLQQVALFTKARDVLLDTFGQVARKNNQVLMGDACQNSELAR
ncbi:E3 SUMO-protein ligase RanBP2 [Lamellibrachia satsuma]|nr:E3 SUMO-protein ligase RanBP2 [Lamellibrachia satsuma]